MWAEIARPQIHGYDMTDAAFISPYRFASTGDEKVTRVFDAPGGFVDSLQSLGVSTESRDTSSRPKGATVPPLGLSNRALGRAAEVSDLPTPHVANQAIDSVSQAFSALPTEEELATTTLWPEVEKIYGHGYELVTLAASHDGKYIATACRASNADHAVVRVQSTETWDLVGEPLAGHNLSITRIAFSPDDSHILTCSRDRGWRLFQRKADDGGYEPVAQDERAHARMILDCCWLPGGAAFATASRDKTIKIWSQGAKHQWEAISTIKLSESITAVEAVNSGDSVLLALGTESGAVSIYTVKSDSLETTLALELDITSVSSSWSPLPLSAVCDVDRNSATRTARLSAVWRFAQGPPQARTICSWRALAMIAVSGCSGSTYRHPCLSRHTCMSCLLLLSAPL